MGVRADREQNWRQYTWAMLLFSLVSCVFTYAIPAPAKLSASEPAGLGALTPDLVFNTAVSPTSNTNWQSYGGESTMSYLSQMVAPTIHNFTSAATGIAIAAALVRGIARHSTTLAISGSIWFASLTICSSQFVLFLPSFWCPRA